MAQREQLCTHSYLNTGFTSPLQNCLKDFLLAERHPKLGSVLRALQPFLTRGIVSLVL